MRNRKELTDAFRRATESNADRKTRSLFGWWFSQLDVTEGTVFRNEEDARKLEDRMAANLHGHFFPQARKRTWVSVAIWPSAAVLLLGALLYLWVNRGDGEPAFVEVVAASGQRKKVTLSDGSTVALNSGSTLQIPTDFASTRREVFIAGEGFFEVAPDAHKPFIVRTGQLDIHVLGTSFNVRHYDADDAIDVVVSTGKVQVTADSSRQLWTLFSGERLSFQPSTNSADKTSINPDDYTGWRLGQLVFRGERLDVICRQLERWYDVTIVIERHALKEKRISISLENESLQTMLQVISKVGAFEYTLEGQHVCIQ